MGNFSLSGVNKSNTTNAKIALSNDSAKNDSLVVIDKNVTADKNHSKTSTIPNTNNDITKGNMENYTIFTNSSLSYVYPIKRLYSSL